MLVGFVPLYFMLLCFACCLLIGSFTCYAYRFCFVLGISCFVLLLFCYVALFTCVCLCLLLFCLGFIILCDIFLCFLLDVAYIVLLLCY